MPRRKSHERFDDDVYEVATRKVQYTRDDLDVIRKRLSDLRNIEDSFKNAKNQTYSNSEVKKYISNLKDHYAKAERELSPPQTSTRTSSRRSANPDKVLIDEVSVKTYPEWNDQSRKELWNEYSGLPDDADVDEFCWNFAMKANQNAILRNSYFQSKYPYTQETVRKAIQEIKKEIEENAAYNPPTKTRYTRKDLEMVRSRLKAFNVILQHAGDRGDTPGNQYVSRVHNFYRSLKAKLSKAFQEDDPIYEPNPEEDIPQPSGLAPYVPPVESYLNDFNNFMRQIYPNLSPPPRDDLKEKVWFGGSLCGGIQN